MSYRTAWYEIGVFGIKEEDNGNIEYFIRINYNFIWQNSVNVLCWIKRKEY